ncbi:phosphoglycerate mutase-like protein [Suhomyces tanzawaensis NRRL Y-17324]|uniref:Phosphoglycerate mutase-like protein n=1 Tax=Suhomyces tanzawaensis NRRL Y-17324 TaxID=984487 RepID=A0A1E4SRR0_9ASCO|nr:phosphoglycerate mutase-like protein [Suhomyces tanzawaensis NRRL Y-17324]ODV82191.1 phosphoglycerate mutase-like protein [Suhomyces tanzawaensis NRRL Y-17324]
MSSMVPNARDRVDAHGDLDQDDLYFQNLAKCDVNWRFETVQGFFKQASLETDDMKFDYVNENFGITKPWEQLKREVDELNEKSPPNVAYKVLFLARHGQGWHNIALQKYPKEEWFAKWRFLGTDNEITWGPDAELTELGVKQADENCVAWNNQLREGAPFPTKFYVSPLLRSIKTLERTWKDQSIPLPVVLENLRETIGVHLCHQRAPKSDIGKKFPFLTFEPSFTESDELAVKYNPVREELHQQFLRINGVLQELFEDDKLQFNSENSFVSITSHAGTIRSFITVVGHRKFTIPTGGMIPILVKGTRK